MAALTLFQPFDEIWAPGALVGGTILTRTATSMTYTSDLGFTITLTGIGFTYDASGFPSAGTVGRLVVAQNGVTFADYSGVSVNLARAAMAIFGYDEQNGGHHGPDPYNLIENMLRGNDLSTGSDFGDDLVGSKGNDTILGGDGGDGVGGEQGNDSMDGGADWDALYYDNANGSWESFQGVDLDAATGIAIDNWGDTDHFSNFERFVDSLYSDTLRGADVNEEFAINRGNDLVDGRGGFDWVDFSQAEMWGGQRGVKVSLATGIARDSWKGTDTLSNVEGARGTRFNDTLIGDGAHNAFSGGDGVDILDGGGGSDALVYWWVGEDNDGGHGVIVNLSAAQQVIDDGYGNADAAQSFEDVDGSRFADRLTGSSVQNFLWGNDGNDTMSGLGGADDLGGGWGLDSISGGTGNDSIGGNGDDDTVSGGTGVDQFYFGWDLVDVGVDRITDFTAGSETIWVGSWWGGDFTTETLVANQFRSGAGVTSANNASQRFIYNTTTGDLYFDGDGNGTDFAAVKFSTLSNLTALTFNDIHIMF